MAEKKICVQTELTCEPLDTLEEVARFLQDPPVWRTLCKELIRHSQSMVKNSEVNEFFGNNILETPQAFCHFDSEEFDVNRHDRKTLPKTLVCHDMANGYHDDSFVDGTGNYDAYTFYNWAAVDIFCYFSHHFITIPPLGWINVGHAHGVKVIGTVITEWAEGVVLWDKILSSELQSDNFASALVAIAKTLKFDGWLLNVENKVSKPGELLRFVRTLHSALHQELPGAVLVWYDSVTVDGHLNWQNGLNEKNKAFFDIVDGFFTNYSWSEKDLETSTAMAGDRLADLYVGIDVWGRNFYGGGQFNTQEAIKVAASYGCSLAIFAQAWTYEAMSEDVNDINTVANSENLDKYEKFLLRDRALWTSIWPYLNTKLPTELPFQTSFCRGQGKKRRLYGEVICPVPWYNLRHMQYQPNSVLGPHGFLLSTRDNIAGLSRLGLLKDRAGILRYRRSLRSSQLQPDGQPGEVSLALEADSLTIFTREETTEIAKEDGEGTVKKRKMKDAFRNFFRIKATKIEHEDDRERKDSKESEAAGTVENGEDTVGSAGTSGRSMLQMSVQLRLGEHPERARYALAYVPLDLECLEPFFADSFLGGSCLKVNPPDDVGADRRVTRLFHCDFRCDSGLIACVVTKRLLGHEHQFLNVDLDVRDGDGDRRCLVLVGRSIPSGRELSPAAERVHLYPAEPDFRELQKYMVLNEPDFYVPVGNAYGWLVRYYEIELPGGRVMSVNVRSGLAEGPILLGHLGLCARARPGPGSDPE